jgi:hypothetical protein
MEFANGTAKRVPHSAATGLALLASALLLVACDAGSASAGAEASGSTAAMGKERDPLGSVNLPRPDWLPADFPLPADAHITIVSTNTDTTPKMFQLQARTMAEKDAFMADAMRWAEARGLHPVDEGSNVKLDSAFSIMSFDGVQFSPSNMQVTDEGGKYRRIILSVVGPPWE